MFFPRKNIKFFAVFTLIMVGVVAGCSWQKERTGADPIRIGHCGIMYRGVETKEEPVTPHPREQKKKEVAKRLDTEGLLYNSKVVVDKDPRMLEPPETVAEYAGKDYIIAKEPPEIEFVIVPVEPVFLGESPVKSKSNISNTPGVWSCWCQANFDRRTGKFYSFVGDEGKYNAHIFFVEYDPAIKKVRCLTELNKVLGRTKYHFGEGKIHGWLDFYQSKDIDKPHLWYCTYWAKFDEPDEEDFATGYEGGRIMSYDVLTGEIVDYGVPMVRSSWPYHHLDTRRGIMYAVGMFGEFLAWDVNEQRIKWAGYLPAGMSWWVRAILVDEETGMVYTSNQDKEADPNQHFIKYDPFKNRFFKLDCHVPANIGASRFEEDGGYSPLRAHTRLRGSDGLFWCVTMGGELFTFDPVKEEIVDKGPNWSGRQRYTAGIVRSPGERYLYYLPGAHGHGYSEGSPLIQYDTKTGTRKVLAFMFPYYYERYGYTPSGTFSIKLDDKGERLFILWNGAFVEHTEGKSSGEIFGQCSIMLVSIPESERIE